MGIKRKKVSLAIAPYVSEALDKRGFSYSAQKGADGSVQFEIECTKNEWQRAYEAAATKRKGEMANLDHPLKTKYDVLNDIDIPGGVPFYVDGDLPM